MKKNNLFRASLLCMMLMACVATKAQTTEESNSLQLEETSIGYWGFDGFSNYGASWNRYGLRKAWGSELNIRSDFKQYSNYSVDIGVNYIHPIWGKDNQGLYAIGAVGPSLRAQRYPKPKYHASTGKTTIETKSKMFIDLFGSIRLMYKYNKFRISAGAFLWSAEFKFDSDYTNMGYGISVGYDI